MAFSRSSTVVGTSATDLLAAVSGETVVIGLVVANVGTASDTITVYIEDNAGTPNQYHLIKNAPIPVGSTLSVLDGKVVLGNGDKVVCNAGTSATALEATISVLTI
jgi:hypothetical protein